MANTGLAHVTADVYPSEWEDFGSACFDDVRGSHPSIFFFFIITLKPRVE